MESLVKKPDYLIASEIELIYKNKVKASERPKIKGAHQAYRVLIESWNPDEIEFREVFKIMLISRANRVLGIYEVAKGGLASVIVDVRMVFAAALKANASALILAHNHPSGQLVASQADKNLTDQIKKAGDILDVPVLDHLIVTSEGYLSFANEGLI